MGAALAAAEAGSTVRQFGEFLVAQRAIDRDKLERSVRWRDSKGGSLVDVMTSLGLIAERDVASLLSEFLDIPLLGPSDYPEMAPFDHSIDEAYLRRVGVLPIAETQDAIVLALVDPFDEFVRRALAMKLGKTIEPRIAVRSELEAALENLFSDGRSRLSDIVERADDGVTEADDDEERLMDLASEAPVIQLVNLLIRRAVEMRASDIHIEPFANRLRVRYRVDGVLKDVEAPPSRFRWAIVSRVKVMARMNIAERRLPQDGRIKLVVQGKEIDIRVSTMPTMHGEGAVLRILDGSEGVYALADLGFGEDHRRAFLRLLREPNGIVLVTGPTGSGKTTTLYASLLELNAPETKMITVEDPVEYQLEGVTQIQVKPQIGLGFADLLRSILRHDPDTIMIGEIRDLETAEIAVQASLTGHLVLSTLHTNSAVGALTRLLDMGVESFLLTATLGGVVGQRLVRRLCRSCRESVAVTPQLVDELGLAPLLDAPRGPTIYRRSGCEACDGTGYAGRSSIAEVLVLDDHMRALLLRGTSTQEIAAAAREAGMITMYQDGLRKVLDGVTSVEEVLRVTADTSQA